MINQNKQTRNKAEESFHDNWAHEENIAHIDVKLMNEAATVPEMRYIHQVMGDIRGKNVLDVGCGLGEASIYFAMKGAKVVASDISQGMLDMTLDLAEMNDVKLSTHKATAEELQLDDNQLFDYIYLGNLLHHVDIEDTLESLIKHLAPDGVLCSWDPLAYNPIINIYRKFAMEVRTEDEHPLKRRDIRLFNKYFKKVNTKPFWLTTLSIFIIMALLQRRNPNRERYWKVVVEESNKWEWLYNPLEKIDRLILKIFPFLGYLCWNIVIIASNPLKLDNKN